MSLVDVKKRLEAHKQEFKVYSKDNCSLCVKTKNEMTLAGVLPMMKIYNDTIVAFNQRGKRKGAITIALPFWHKDIEDFLEAKSEVGDLRTKLFDTQPQVVIPDLFMKMKKEDKLQPWYTFSPHEVEVKLGFNLNDYNGEDFETKYIKCVEAWHDDSGGVPAGFRVPRLGES